jgi:hypothetical protein
MAVILVRDHCHGVKKPYKKATVRVKYTPGLSAQIDRNKGRYLVSSQR